MLADPPAPTPSLTERLLAEGLLGLAAAARLLGTSRGGKPTHPATLTRWAAAGIKLADGRTVRLEAVRLNGRLATTRAALVRFVEAQQPDATPPPTDTPPIRSPAARRTAASRAEEALLKMGC